MKYSFHDIASISYLKQHYPGTHLTKYIYFGLFYNGEKTPVALMTERNWEGGGGKEILQYCCCTYENLAMEYIVVVMKF